MTFSSLWDPVSPYEDMPGCTKNFDQKNFQFFFMNLWYQSDLWLKFHLFMMLRFLWGARRITQCELESPTMTRKDVLAPSQIDVASHHPKMMLPRESSYKVDGPRTTEYSTVLDHGLTMVTVTRHIFDR